MSSLLRHWYAHSGAFHALLFPLLRLRESLLLGHCLPPRLRISRDFRRTFGHPLPWAAPRTLNEKLNCMKHLVRLPLQRTCADKHAVRAYVAEKIGPEHLIPLLATFTRARDVTPAAIPSPSFILKVNHGSGQNIVVRDAATTDFVPIRLQLSDWMHTSHYLLSCEQPYRGIRPLILAERLLLAPDGTLDPAPMIAELARHAEAQHHLPPLADQPPDVLPLLATHLPALRFHLTIAHMLLAVARTHPDLPLALVGGCFQNPLLLHLTESLLRAENRSPYSLHVLPPSDAGLAPASLLALPL